MVYRVIVYVMYKLLSLFLLNSVKLHDFRLYMYPYFSTEAALTAALLRVESDHSVAGSDEHIMDGGVTIRERKDIIRPAVSTSLMRETLKLSDTLKPFNQSAEQASSSLKYSFLTKRILLTEDPKERGAFHRSNSEWPL